MGIALDTTEMEEFGARCRQIARKGLSKTPSKTGGSIVGAGGNTLLSSREIKQVWRAGAKGAKDKAAQIAPKSGSKKEYTWPAEKRTPNYAGKHGDLGLKSTYKTKVWKHGGGFFLNVGDTKGNDRQKLNVVVGRFAGFNVRRGPAKVKKKKLIGQARYDRNRLKGTSAVGPMRNWVQDAINQEAPKIAKGLGIAVAEVVAEDLTRTVQKAARKGVRQPAASVAMAKGIKKGTIASSPFGPVTYPKEQNPSRYARN